MLENLSNKFCKFLLQNINNKNREICKESRIFFMEKFNPKDHITEMKRLWDELEIKPEWLSMEQIEEYESEMIE